MWLVRKVAPAEKASRPSQKWVDAPRGEMPREKRAVCPRPEGLGKAAWLQEEHSERSLMDPSSNGKQELRESAVSDKEGRFHVALHELLPMVRSVALPCSPSSSARNGLGLIRGSRRAWCML